MLNVVIIDDHKLVGAGFAHLLSLEDNIHVEYICTSYQEAIEKLSNTVDIAIIEYFFTG